MANVGDEIICPNCKSHSFLVRHSIMNGWSKIGETLNCSSCNLEIDKTIYNKDGNPENVKEENEALNSIAKLSKLFGNETLIKPTLFDNADIKGNFCRDCQHYISHPFLNRCDIHRKNVNPMDDCEQFELKIKSKSS